MIQCLCTVGQTGGKHNVKMFWKSMQYPFQFVSSSVFYRRYPQRACIFFLSALVYPIRVSLNVFTEFSDNLFSTTKRIAVLEPATSCVRGREASTVPGRERIFKLTQIHASVIYEIH